tara:strand:+ start:185 stop:421 length:237 start_codon:yes stop_codon:yes gene_type:complete
MKKDYKISFIMGKEFFDELGMKSTIIQNCKSKKHAKRKFKKLLKKNWFTIREYTYEDYKTDTILREDSDYFNEQEYPS